LRRLSLLTQVVGSERELKLLSCADNVDSDHVDQVDGARTKACQPDLFACTNLHATFSSIVSLYSRASNSISLYRGGFRRVLHVPPNRGPLADYPLGRACGGRNLDFQTLFQTFVKRKARNLKHFLHSFMIHQFQTFCASFLCCMDVLNCLCKLA